MNNYSRKRTRVSLVLIQRPSMSLAPPVSQRLDFEKRSWIDVSEIALGTGLRGRAAVSMALAEALTPGAAEIDGDFDQRLWDALWRVTCKLWK